MPGGHVRIFKKKAIINEIEQLGFLLKNMKGFIQFTALIGGLDACFGRIKIIIG